jgi:hypothetical protein
VTKTPFIATLDWCSPSVVSTPHPHATILPIHPNPALALVHQGLQSRVNVLFSIFVTLGGQARQAELLNKSVSLSQFFKKSAKPERQANPIARKIKRKTFCQLFLHDGFKHLLHSFEHFTTTSYPVLVQDTPATCVCNRSGSTAYSPCIQKCLKIRVL